MEMLTNIGVLVGIVASIATIAQYAQSQLAARRGAQRPVDPSDVARESSTKPPPAGAPNGRAIGTLFLGTFAALSTETAANPGFMLILAALAIALGLSAFQHPRGHVLAGIGIVLAILAGFSALDLMRLGF